MTDNDINYDDFLIRIRPFRKDDGQWTGEIDLSVMTLPDNDFDDEDYGQLIHLCTMVAATIPIMETDESLRELVHNYVTETFDKEYTHVLEDTDTKEVEYDGNIIKINFNTTTKGSA